ncbi:UNVERIFIED_CONTAM: putative zinc finger protein [Acetivibrio alkalicellulosi]
MECKFNSYIIQEYLEGTIDDLEKVLFEEHMKECKKCRLELTHLKLLLFEIDHLKEIEVIPKDVEFIRNNVLDEIFNTKSSGFEVKKFIKKQKETIALATNFMNYVPGKTIAKKGIKGANSLLSSASKKGFKYGLKLIQERI